MKAKLMQFVLKNINARICPSADVIRIEEKNKDTTFVIGDLIPIGFDFYDKDLQNCVERLLFQTGGVIYEGKPSDTFTHWVEVPYRFSSFVFEEMCRLDDRYPPAYMENQPPITKILLRDYSLSCLQELKKEIRSIPMDTPSSIKEVTWDLDNDVSVFVFDEERRIKDSYNFSNVDLYQGGPTPNQRVVDKLKDSYRVMFSMEKIRELTGWCAEGFEEVMNASNLAMQDYRLKEILDIYNNPETWEVPEDEREYLRGKIDDFLMMYLETTHAVIKYLRKNNPDLFNGY